MSNIRTIEQYWDLNQYAEEEIMEKIENEKKQLANKLINVNVYVNDWGVVVVKMDFKSNSIDIKKVKRKVQNNMQERSRKRKTYTAEPINYGPAKVYKPY